MGLWGALKAYLGAAGGDSTGGPVTLGVDEDVMVHVSNGDTTNQLLTLTPRGASGGTITRNITGGGAVIIAGTDYSRISFGTSSTATKWTRGSSGSFRSMLDSGASFVYQAGTWSLTSTLAVPSLQDNQDFSGSIANATADAVSQAGANTLPIGALVRFRLAIAGSLITASDPLTYIRLVGNTTGNIYAAAYANNSGAGAQTGQIRMPVAEKLDIHTANADTVAHVFTGSWEAFTGE